MTEEYSEPIQFVTLTHTTKEEGRKNKAEAASGVGKARFATSMFTFSELVYYHEKGMTFRRLPASAVQSWRTRILIMDFDNKSRPGYDPVNVTTDELDQMIHDLRLKARYTSSGDRKQYHYHLFILLDNPITSDEEYVRVRDSMEQAFEDHLSYMRGYKNGCPRLTDPALYAQTTVFGPAQPVSTKIKLPWDDPTEHLERTIKHPEPRFEQPMLQCFNTVPLSTAQFAKWLVEHGVLKEEKLTDLEYNYRNMTTLPYMRNGSSKDTSKIEVGNRNDKLQHFGFCLYSVARLYNVWLESHGRTDLLFTENDIISSFKFYVNRSYDTRMFNIEYYIQDFKDRLFDAYKGLSNREYCELMKAKYPHHYSENTNAKTRRYVASAAESIVRCFQQENTVKFASVAERDRILRDKCVSLNAVKAEAERLGLTVTTVQKPKGGSRVGAGRKPSKTVNETAHEPGRGRGRPATIGWDSLSSKGQLFDGVFYYTIKLSLAERKFINRQGLAIKKINKSNTMVISSKTNNETIGL